ncbi:MAG: hypothetical protein ABI927_01015 [Gaiellaceae bacterium]
MRRLLTIALALGALGGGAVASAELTRNSIATTANPAVPSPADFAKRIDNPWFPLTPGTTLVYRGTKDGKAARDVLTVTHRTAVIDGVRCTVVADRLFLGGRLHERTTDWYAQDKRGNVWYFGEATVELDKNGRVTSTEGSFQSGRDGAKAGIFINAKPKVGDAFRQEYYKGHAEDHFQVLSLAASVKVPYIASSKALLTKETTPLEPGVVDHKYYVRGIGTVLEQAVKGGTERLVLVAMRKG